MSQLMFNCLCQTKSLRESLNMYQGILEENYLKTGNYKTKEKESAIKYYNRAIFNKPLIAFHRRNFNDLYDIYDKDIPEMLFDLDGNKKAVKSFIEKLNKLQKEGRSLAAAYKDIHRFRLVITNSTHDNEEMMILLQKATLVTIKYFLDKDFILCEPNPVKDTGFIPEKYPEVYIPSFNIIPREYKPLVKNYVNNPKKKGYQSIHLFFVDCKNNPFEVQLRTLAMDTRAKYGSAKQEDFKAETRDVKNWDLEKISVENFEYFENQQTKEEIIIDKAGILKPVRTFVRKKTFY